MSKIDRRLLKASLLVYAIADTPSQTEYQYIVGSNPSGVFEGATPNSIAYYENDKWNFIPPQTDGLEVFCIATQALLRWNGSNWVSEMSLSASRLPYTRPYTFCHILTQEEIDDRAFDIRLLNIGDYVNYSLQYHFESLFLNGVLQIYTDYGDAIKYDFRFENEENNNGNLQKITVIWGDGYGFNNLDIRAGDIITLKALVTYIPK